MSKRIKKLAQTLPPVPVVGCWMPGPANGGRTEGEDFLSVGDRLLVLVHCVDQYNRDFWDAHVITATETGFGDSNGDSWGAWAWDEVSWYLWLTQDTMPQL